jgi:hypothetical protein
MSGPNPLSFNEWVQQVAVMGVYEASETAGVWAFNDESLATSTPMILNYAEQRIARDMDFLSAQTSNIYTLTAGVNVFALPVNDFLAVQTLEIVQLSNGQVVTATPLLAVSKEFIQNCYSGLTSANTPQYYALFGDNFGTSEDVNTNILLGPPPNFAYSLRVTGTTRPPSLYSFATAGPADTSYTYISNFLPEMLVIASMIYISAYQRNWSATSDDPQMPMSYEKQYQALRLGAIPEENRRKSMASGWSSYSTPTAATPTR